MTDKILAIRIEGVSPLMCHAIPRELLFPEEKSVLRGEEGTPREQADRGLYRATVGKKKNVLVIPGQNLLKCLVEAGKFQKAGRSKLTTRDSSLVTAAVALLNINIPIEHKAPWEVESNMVTNEATKGKVPCHRPRFDEWALEFRIQVDVKMFDMKMVRRLVDDAGKKIGLGPRRPERKGPFGRFVVTRWEEENGQSQA